MSSSNWGYPDPKDSLSQMTSGVKIAEQKLEKEWNWYINSWFSTADFLLYIFIAILFFSIGKSFNQIQARMHERMVAKRFEKHYKLKTEDKDDDEDKPFSPEDQYELRQLRQELDESRQEVKQLSEELRRLRSKESSLDAENQILKSKLL